jgi:hypothetical protein
MPVTRNAKGDQEVMFKVRLAIVALFGALTLSAVAASSASAGWFIEGAALASGSKAALTSTAKIDTNPVLAVSAGSSKVKVECGGSLLHASEPNLIGTETLKAKSITFEGCKVTEPTTGCALEGQPTTITTNPLVATATGGASFPEDRLTFGPQTGKNLGSLDISVGSTCLNGEGEKPIKGSLTLKAPTLQEEQATQPIEALGSTENNSLEIAGDKTILERGETLIALTTGKRFSSFAESKKFLMTANLTKVKNNGEKVKFTITALAAGKVEDVFGLESPHEKEFKLKLNPLCEKPYVIEQQCEFEAEYDGGVEPIKTVLLVVLKDEVEDFRQVVVSN